MKILLICGHGAGDPGACACGYKEADLVREQGRLLQQSLLPYADVDLYDTSLNLYKVQKAGKTFNFKPYDYVIELHFNAGVGDQNGNGKSTGIEILVHTSEQGVGVETAILNNVCALGFKSRGVKKLNNLLNMNICKGKQGVSYALIETCFIDDLDDMKLYINKRDEVVTAITNGIVTGFGLNKINKELTEASEITNELATNHFPIIDKSNFIKALEEAKTSNSPLYWGYYKLVNNHKE